jgi:hypothetical protein
VCGGRKGIKDTRKSIIFIARRHAAPHSFPQPQASPKANRTQTKRQVFYSFFIDIASMLLFSVVSYDLVCFFYPSSSFQSY